MTLGMHVIFHCWVCEFQRRFKSKKVVKAIAKLFFTLALFWKLLCSHIFCRLQKGGFEIIDHSIFLLELGSLHVDQTLCVRIRAFLTNRAQAIRVGNSLFPWRHTHGGVPVGTN